MGQPICHMRSNSISPFGVDWTNTSEDAFFKTYNATWLQTLMSEKCENLISFRPHATIQPPIIYALLYLHAGSVEAYMAHSKLFSIFWGYK